MNAITTAERLQTKAVGDQILCINLGIDWAALGYTLWLRVRLGTVSRDLALSVVPLQTQQAFRSTTATDFPTAADYAAQIIGKKAGAEERFSSVFSLSVGPNLAAP